jgi:molybdenum cofactor guanylyltransferase
MMVAGFVLAGGRSHRMGTDKALLPWRGRPLVVHMAETVRAVAQPVHIIGAPDRYAGFGYPVVADEVAGEGPLGGILTALGLGLAPWNLVVACDMPALETATLRELLEHAAAHPADCCLPYTAPDRAEPLCAVYHVRALPALRRAFDAGVRKCTEAFEGLRIAAWTAPDPRVFANLNTEAEWQSYLNDKEQVTHRS